uniref:Large ribosomal subunit protein uL29c n=1 Tax=Platysiphonia delicata TaxID=2006979 RepID=A0A1Z1M1H4_9FLOR|nr:ribosomal protein L29 [Platysiphonia delicata]ARW59635.1 ribosomal protein L29 [Platysiphonia delicata]
MTKKKEYLEKIKDLSAEDIENEIIKLKKELIFFNIKKKTKQNVKTSLIKYTKNCISQLLTIEAKSLKLNPKP